MKSILIISSVTFALIFGGIAIMSNQMIPGESGSKIDPGDVAAVERLVREAAIERDRLQREHEALAALRQSQAAQELIITQLHGKVLSTLGRLEEQQAAYISERDAAAERLAKMYEAMKPDKAAEILASLDLDVTLAIFSRMKERPAARILSFMHPGRAAQISTRLSLQGGD